MPTLLVKDAILVTQDAQGRILRGDLLARDGVVESVGGDLGSDADEVIHADGDVCLPGFVNAHTHSPMTLLRGLGDDLPLEEWLKTRIWPAERHLTREDVETGTELALLEMVRTGTVAFNDMYFFADATAEAAARAGVRAAVGATLIDFDTPDVPKERQEEHARRFIARWQGHPLVTPTLSPHSTYSCSRATLDQVRAVRDDTGAPVHIHCSETRMEVQTVLESSGLRPVGVLREHGLLAGSVLAHCGWVTKEEVRDMAREGAHVAHCPVSNMKLATGGVAPLEEMRAAGVNVALGTDGAASNNVLDVLETAKYAALVQKNDRWDASAAPAAAVLAMATLGGRRALRLDAAGLAPGARADLALVSTKHPHMTPLHDPVSALVYCAGGHDVRATVVDGRVLYLDGEFRTLDAERVLRRARDSAHRLARAAGLE